MVHQLQRVLRDWGECFKNCHCVPVVICVVHQLQRVLRDWGECVVRLLVLFNFILVHM